MHDIIPYQSLSKTMSNVFSLMFPLSIIVLTAFDTAPVVQVSSCASPLVARNCETFDSISGRTL